MYREKLRFYEEEAYWKTMREPPRVRLKEGYEIREDNRVHKKEDIKKITISKR